MDDTRKTPPKGQRGKAPPDAARPVGTAAGLDPISAGLRALWAAMENEPVPDEFLALLDRIDAASRPAETPDRDPDTGPAA